MITENELAFLLALTISVYICVRVSSVIFWGGVQRLRHPPQITDACIWISAFPVLVISYYCLLFPSGRRLLLATLGRLNGWSLSQILCSLCRVLCHLP
ncbi:hypothetical protein BJY52DRAFT_855416 [Lactarius psammicola]|nr:hypothetical protein BJY52DRAFT_855416 [Lactarius psammicola]